MKSFSFFPPAKTKLMGIICGISFAQLRPAGFVNICGAGRALCGAGRASLFINHYHSGEKALESSNKYEVSADGALLIRWIRKIYLLGYISN